MIDSAWIEVRYPSQVPAEGVVVETKIDDHEFGVRNVGLLKRRGRLWFFPDDSMYVYYQPSHWRDCDPAPDAVVQEIRR